VVLLGRVRFVLGVDFFVGLFRVGLRFANPTYGFGCPAWLEDV